MSSTKVGQPPSRRLWLPQLGGLPRSFWYLWAGTLLNRLGTFVAPFLSLYLTADRGFSISRAGVVLTLFGLGSALSQPIGGALADRIGRRRTMVLGLTTAAAALLAVGASGTLLTLGAAVLVYGLCLDLYRPASQAAIADLVPDDDRPRAFALVFWAVNLGFSVATPLGGYLASRGYWLLFVLDAIASLAFAVLVLRGVPETRPLTTGAPGRLVDVLRDRLMVATVLSITLQATVYLQAYFTLPLAFAADGLGPGTYGLAMALNGVLIVVMQPMLLAALDRSRRGRLLLAAMVLQGTGFGMTAFAVDVPTHVAAIVVWTGGFAACLVAGVAMLAVSGAADRRMPMALTSSA